MAKGVSRVLDRIGRSAGAWCGLRPAGAAAAALAAPDWVRRRACPATAEDPQPAARVGTEARVRRLRSLMRDPRHLLDAYLVTSSDQHQSEFLARSDRRLEWISGFSGSYGEAVVTAQRGGGEGGQAALWTDGRYHAQADDQLDCGWQLVRHGVVQLSVQGWLSDVLHVPAARVGADPHLLPHTDWHALSVDLASINVTLVEIRENLIDKIWTERMMFKKYPAHVLPVEYAGETWENKVSRLRSHLALTGADAMVVTALDEVAWLLNIRGHDIPYYPVVHAYVIVSQNMLLLFIDPANLSDEVREHLKIEKCFSANCFSVRPYSSILAGLHTESQQWNTVLLPTECTYSKGASQAIYSAVSENKWMPQQSPIIFMKSVKNSAEIRGMQNAHIRDAAALCDFFAYMEQRMKDGFIWDELTVAETVDEFRREQKLSRGPSFATIAGFGPNGALPHYEPNNITSLTIDNSSMLVLDSGGQYLDGTTDVTRTLHFGEPTDFQKEVYTRVLIGSIQMASLIFPEDVQTSNIDVLARAPLWKVGLDYQHGTGHGIGSYLSVHESPIIVVYSTGNETFQKGQFFSNEPGYYKEGHFGVRLENILEVERRQTEHQSHKTYYGFKTVTLVPYEPKLIKEEMLTSEQRDWLNEYNSQIRSLVGAELKHQKRMKGFYWMMSKTGYVPPYCARYNRAAAYIPLCKMFIFFAMLICWLF
ncbi:xaa-Pro aminopeptidase 1-like [Schistocerca cancellata]|uniref:xaa-Pro aminopeptidase 1-like n=1 Tax=Schistocerca cancellata TaxID=274614 RepID=UPI0021183114|nr:xaa-Pro aminopeptidase 1-like [Schistocerca cancellata]